MQKRCERLTTVGFMIVTGLFTLGLAVGRPPDIVAKVVSSSKAKAGGAPLLAGGTLLSGDSVSVEEGGRVLLSFSPTARGTLGEKSMVRFTKISGRVTAELSSGTFAVEKDTQDAVTIETAKFTIQPENAGKAECMVLILPDKTTVVGAQHGRVTITDTSSGKSYTLAEGLYAEIPATATATVVTAQAQAGGKVPWRVGSLSHAASTGLVTAGAGGAAALAAAGASSGGSASPSKP